MLNHLFRTFAAHLVLGTLAAASLNPLSPIVIGVSNVQSGPSQSLGIDLVQGSRSYFDFINSNGGIRGRNVLMIVKDDQYEPEPAVRNTNDLITRDKVLFLFDFVGTPTLTRVLPLLSYYRDQTIVNVAPFTGADPQRTAPYSHYVFNIRASYREETHSLVSYLLAKGFNRIGFFGQADAYGKSGQVGVQEALQRRGLKIIASVTYRRNDADSSSMRDQVAYLRSKGADAVIAVGVYRPCSSFIREARRSNWQVPIANVSFVNAEAMLALLKADSKTLNVDLTRNLINSQVVPSPQDRGLKMVRAYLAHRANRPPGFTSLEGWLNATVVTEALRRAGPNPSRQSFVSSMESLHGWDPGLGYPLEFSPTEHQGLHHVWLTRTQDAAWVSEVPPLHTP